MIHFLGGRLCHSMQAHLTSKSNSILNFLSSVSRDPNRNGRKKRRTINAVSKAVGRRPKKDSEYRFLEEKGDDGTVFLNRYTCAHVYTPRVWDGPRRILVASTDDIVHGTGSRFDSKRKRRRRRRTAPLLARAAKKSRDKHPGFPASK